MATKEEAYKGLERVKAKFSDPNLKEKFKDFTKKLQFSFTDISVNYYFDVVNGQVKTLKEGKIDNPDIQVSMKTDTFIGILDKKINPATSYMTGKIKVKGSMGDLIKLQKIM